MVITAGQSSPYQRMYHVTSLSTALRILNSQLIWSKDIDGAANLHPNMTSKNVLDLSAEVALEFEWNGSVSLEKDSFDVQLNGKSDTAYWMITNFSECKTSELKVWCIKIPRGTSGSLKCVNAVFFSEILEEAKSDCIMGAQVKKICKLASRGVDISVPTTEVINELKKLAQNPVRSSRRASASVFRRFLQFLQLGVKNDRKK